MPDTDTKKNNPVVAIDGPSGAGKSTTAKTLATAIGAGYLDTGAMYRAATLAALDAEVDLSSADEILSALNEAKLEIGTTVEDPYARLNGESVDLEIRTERVTAAVSQVAGHKKVREHLISEQKAAINAARKKGGIVVEGRDIAEVVAPEADLKVYLTADEKARASRRALEIGATASDTAEDIKRRDKADSKTTKPMEAADGAHVIDSTKLSVVEVVAKLLALLNDRGIDD
ncbi:(d)CMP kinase [Natronoglycomyces albus]|uniref:Cytidylate kinase n=1 Tax=Natronoglycomyces albus TaxID=2811108 RepID=A0A895XK83_9ACTN|nr:(d)CMP kinase [Natronoglycomyces albus]QSB03849.1 (d)CMP kinase [Natronoglycomyces albus]